MLQLESHLEAERLRVKLTLLRQQSSRQSYQNSLLSSEWHLLAPRGIFLPIELPDLACLLNYLSHSFWPDSRCELAQPFSLALFQRLIWEAF